MSKDTLKVRGFMRGQLVDAKTGKIVGDTGWKKIAKKEFPFLVDTNIFCKHIDLTSGKTYPIGAK